MSGNIMDSLNLLLRFFLCSTPEAKACADKMTQRTKVSILLKNSFERVHTYSLKSLSLSC